MKIATDHGFPRPSFGGSDPNAFDAFKNERDYIAQGARMKTTVAAMDWAAAEIERLRDDRWKHGAECMRQAVLQQLPRGPICDPELIADMIRAIAVPSTGEQSHNSVAEPARPATAATAGPDRESKGHGR